MACTAVQVLQVVQASALCTPSLLVVAQAGLHWALQGLANRTLPLMAATM